MQLSDFIGEWAGQDRRLAMYKESIGYPYQESHTMRYPEQQLTRLVEDGASGLYISVNPYDPETMQIRAIERLYFDFDCKEKVRYALDDTVRFCKKLIEYYNVSPLVFFSGSKGYAVYVFLQEPIIGPEQELKEIYEELQTMLVKPDSYQWLDPAPFGDLKRVSRVPFSVHQKSKELCIPVDISGETPQGYRPERGFTETFRCFGLSNKVVSVARLNVAANRKKSHNVVPFKGDGKPRPCLVDVMMSNGFPKVSKGYDGHNLMVSAIVEYFYNGYSKEQILGLLEKKTGFDYSHSSKFVDYIISKYTPRKCSTIEEYGGCVSDVCPNAKNKKISPGVWGVV